MRKPKIHSLRFLFRKPYKILLCVFANLLVLLFTMIEGVEMTGTRAAMGDAMKSRYYTGTLMHAVEGLTGADLSYGYNDTRPIGEDAYGILSASPWVDGVRSAELRTARFGGRMRWVRGDAASYAMVVGVASSDISLIENDGYSYQKLLFRPTFLAAGDPDAFTLKYSESAILPSINVSPADESLEILRGERLFIFGEADHEPKTNATVIRHFLPPEDMKAYFQSTLIVKEGPGDEALTDEEFAQKVMKKHGLLEKAEKLNALLDLTAVVEIPTPEMLLPWRNNLMRPVSGRAITEEDAGKKVCMCPSALLAAVGKRVGDTLLLSVSGHDLSGGDPSGIPSLLTEYDREDFGPMEEYEIVGSYSNDQSGVDGTTRSLYLTDILIPRPADRPYEPVSTKHFSFSVYKDNYESYLFDTEQKLSDAGYAVVMAKPDYAEVEAEFESLRQKTRETFLTSGLALSVGLLIAGGSLALFWRSDYLTERRLGAKKREAMGLYCRAFGLVSFSSLSLSALLLFLLGKTGLVPFLAPENLSFASFGIMALFALAELFLFALVALSVILFTDRRKLGGQ